jgi:DNA-binding response OmpR family regulator
VKTLLKRVLFVDDEPSIRATLPVILRRYGFTVTVAATVQGAIETIQNAPFDLLLCDLNIEGQSDGFEVIRAMRQVNPDCVIIVLTGYPALDSALEGLRLHIDDYISKPASADTLVALLADKLAARQPKARILTVAQDEAVLRLWALLLETKGYEVVSAMGLTALDVCKEGDFDLFILGGSLPESDKKKMIAGFRQCCTAPIISVLSISGAQYPDGADYHVNPDVDQVLKLVSDVVRKSVFSAGQGK